MSDEKYNDDKPTEGVGDPSKKFREMEVSEEERQRIEEERKERLDPENRPPNAEVDNTQRTFDPAHGGFVDDEG